MATINLTVIKATPTEKKDGFICKLQNKQDKSIQTAFGKKTASTQTTYYVKLDQAPQIGFSADLDLDQFRIEERAYVPEEGENAGDNIMCKWLHIK